MKPKTTLILPVGYRVFRRLDLAQDKNMAIFLNGSSFLLAIGLVILGLAVCPLDFSFDDLEHIVSECVPQFLTLYVGTVAYPFLHELIHGAVIRLTAHVRPDYGFEPKGLYLYAGSKRAYFSRRDYLLVGLAPVVVWGVVLLVLNLVLPSGWFWPVYVVQIVNLSGAVGDLFVTHQLLFRLPKDVLTMDIGTNMTFYSRAEK